VKPSPVEEGQSLTNGTNVTEQSDKLAATSLRPAKLSLPLFGAQIPGKECHSSSIDSRESALRPSLLSGNILTMVSTPRKALKKCTTVGDALFSMDSHTNRDVSEESNV